MKNDVYRIICFNEQFKVQRKMYSFWDDIRNALLSFVLGKGYFREFSSWETLSFIHSTLESTRLDVKTRKLKDESLVLLNWKVVE